MAAHPSVVAHIHQAKARVRELGTYGCQVEVDYDVPPRRYFRSGLEMLRMANIYTDEANYESAFILYSKFITLFVERLPKHPEYKTCPSVDRQNNKKKLTFVFGIAEELKKKLLKQYEIDEQKWLEEEKRRQEELAREEALRKEKEEKRQAEEALMAEEELQLRREEEERLRLQQEQEFLHMQEMERAKLAEQERARAAIGGLSIGAAASATDVTPPSYDSLPPEYQVSGPPSIPSRELKPSPSAPPMYTSSSDNGVPAVDRTLKPMDHFTSTGGNTGNMYGLRTMLVPGELSLKFMNLALSNTHRNVETLGLLCGTMSQGCFRITHLVLPQQTGTPDSCDMMGEEEVFDVQDKYDLLTLGWIHTHPTQTAFLSSVDMHEHCGYQKLLPEAIAIVCSPKYKETGYFILTPNYGLDIIGNCPQRGFHPHQKEPPLFEESQHVKVDNTLSVKVIDLRK